MEKLNQEFLENQMDDLHVENADIGVLYIDNLLCIRMLTPIVESYTNLRMVDEGRPISHIRFMDEYLDYENDVKIVLQNLVTIEKEVSGEDGMRKLVQTNPYYNQNKQLIGVITKIANTTNQIEVTNIESQMAEIANIDEFMSVQLNLNSLIDHMPGGILRIFYNEQSIETIYISDGLYKMLGYTRQELEKVVFQRDGKGLSMFMEQVDVVFENLQQIAETGETSCSEYKIKTKTGGHLWVQMRGTIVSKIGIGVIIQYIVVDITELKECNIILQREREKLEIIAEISADLLFEYDIKSKTMYYFNEGKDVFNPIQVVENYQESMLRWNLIYEEDIKEFNKICDLPEQGEHDVIVELRKMHSDGQYHWIEVHGRTIFDADGLPERLIGKTANIDARKEREKDSKIRTEHDYLTKLYNKETVLSRITYAFEKSTKEESGALLLIDIDNFRMVNGQFGHLFGDAVICTVADEIHRAFQKISLYGRIGIDEFIVLIRNKTHDEICYILDKFLLSIGDIYGEDSNIMKISCSIGIIEYKGNSNSCDELIKKADNALYHRQITEKSGYTFYDSINPYPQDQERSCYLGDYDIKRENNHIVVTDPQSFVLFALELLDKTKDISSAIQMILIRMSYYFHLTEAALIRQVDNYRAEFDFTWSRGKDSFQEKEGVSHKVFWNTLESCYVENDIAVFHGEDFSNKQGCEDLETSFISVMVYDETTYKGYMLFFSDDETYIWDNEEKKAIKSIASLLAGHILRMKEHQKNSEYMDYLLNYDTVTGFPNYNKFLQIAGQEVFDNPEERYFVIYCDINNFKYINETYGYGEGDAILKKFSIVLQKECREGIQFSRITSDKFVILLKGFDISVHRKNFVLMARQFCAWINKEYDKANLVLVSGISEVDRNLKFTSSSIDHANIARKSVKHLAETECAEFTESLQNLIDLQMEMTGRMNYALDNGEFIVYLQPKIDLIEGKIVGAEALVRWLIDDGTMYYPDSFIPLFEQNGFITKLDYCVLEQVLIWIRKLMDAGEEIVPISLNFSRQHQKEKDFVEQVILLLRKYDVPPEYIEAEITESIFMSDLNLLNSNLSMMKENGIAVSIDDFGSGYSSLNVLASVTADIIKLDKEFLNQLNGDTSLVFLEYLITMLKRLGFKVIAEGVETREQMELLKKADCDMAQGYYYAKPMPIEQFKDFMENQI